MRMAANTDEQQKLVSRVREIISSGTSPDAIKSELEAEGFTVRADKERVLALENINAEIFVHITVDEHNNVTRHDVVTFDDILKKPAGA